MAQRKRKSTKKVSTKKRTSKKRTAKRVTVKKGTAKKRVVRRATPKRKSATKSSRGSAKHVKSIENEIKRLTAIFERQGEDAVEDEADMLEDKIKNSVREGKISEEQAKKLEDALDELDD